MSTFRMNNPERGEKYRLQSVRRRIKAARAQPKGMLLERAAEEDRMRGWSEKCPPQGLKPVVVFWCFRHD